MTVIKEPIVTRPASQHRHSSSMAGSLPKSRTHSQSLSIGSMHQAHRVTRRKSMSSTAANNIAAMAAAAKGISGAPLDPVAASSRRSSKPASHFRGPALGGLSPMASSVPNNGSGFSPGSYSAAAKAEAAVTDGPPLATMPDNEKGNSKSRIRRASEGSRLSKGEGKRTTSNDLRCEKCGKGYKHSSCLTKHLWEHTPEWQYTSKLLISKHQQVQLLEAASVLVAMNADPEVGRDSDHSSVSPPASGTSDMRDDLSSTDTTPPPQIDDHAVGSLPHSHFGNRSTKRYSTNSSSAYSQSYQSAIFSDGVGGHFRQWSNVSDRPTTSGTSVAGSYHEDENDQADLAAAVGLLSCSYGTPKSGPMSLPPDVPPVPPLPAKFLSYNNHDSMTGSTTITAQQSSIRGNYGYGRHESKDVDMDDDSSADDDDYRRANSRSRGRVDDEDDGVFGRMEE
ncbi:hypothetical protein BU24DRAFT_2925 [Aaosphaeria arxii CBS 175.79]|uniref:C2H2-type domain-containing protein n=1 Tax=Aaosphaeria arxii CBS 175.79 TaxID=1450172 RepID=A0A6A5Y699_9PLEO|nr:uncharacterized protein BU24DRAFT_2925 [Aaosphaeria arxii CBS 175.79]KAF2020557.1 hypothetical protein BU24DRAFT_2925 [Aaosphaeria arxii CBS 175.79]